MSEGRAIEWMVEYPSTTLTDDERQKNWNRLTEQYDGSNSDLLRELIDEAAETRLDDPENVEGEDEGEKEQSIAETYDPDDYDGELLTTDELREMSGVVEEINPDHVDDYVESVPNGEAVPLVSAMTRHEHDRVGRDDVVEICRDVGLDTDYYIGSNSGDLNVPAKVSKRHGGSGRTDEKVNVDTAAEDVIRKACVLSTLQVDAGNGVALKPWVVEAYEEWKGLNDDEVEEWVGLDDDRVAVTFTADVIRKALFELGVTGSGRVLDGVEYDEERLAEVEWPRDPEGLVEWYVDSEEPGWAENEDLKSEIAADIRRGIEGE